MDVFAHLAMAFRISFEPLNLLFCFLGVLFGTLVGVLPGLGPTAAISLLLPVTFTLTPMQSIIMLAGIYYGAQYGGSTTSILVNIPGEATSVVTCIDGYQMARKGRAGAALGISAFGSFIGGTFSIIMLMLLAPPLASVALKFGPTESAAIIFFGLTMVTYLSSGSMIKSLMMAIFGLLLGCIGTDLITGLQRFTLGMIDLEDGIGLIPVVMGLFGVAEVLWNIEDQTGKKDIFKTDIKGLLPNRKDWKDSSGAMARGSVVGFFLGLLPGGGALIASLLSYAMEKKVARNPEGFGKGDIRGVAGPETANNAGAGGAFIPLLSLGIPCNVVLALLMGAFMIHKVTPGPLLLKEQPQLFWGIVGSMYIGNIMLLVLNLPLIGLWVKILRVRYAILFPMIFLFCLIGSYSLNNSTFDIFVMIVFGVMGYLMKKFQYDAAPLVMAFVLGPMLEENVRQALLISQGSAFIFFQRPISSVFIITALIFLIIPQVLRFLKRRPLT
ncbi:MAG: tripartite tricarboxylate transporter permease [Deltaproteobacteria bacterium]|nr:MAG: tripartite tricarboxylate transporter permease [Deltaproteobacteria bacterium]